MFVYEVIASVKSDRAAEWHAWIVPHMQEVVDTGCFDSASLERIIDETTSDVLFRVRYQSPSMDLVDRYIADHAPALRAAGIERFGDDVSTRRTIAERLT
jgi:hypothetical protein